MRTRFMMLGPLSVVANTDEVVLSPSRPATLLAALLAHNNEIVGTDFLNRAIWGNRLPTTARSTLQTYISRLRRLFVKFGFSRELLETVPNGYRLMVDIQALDLTRFRALSRQAELTSDRHAMWNSLTEALSLWRGTPIRNVDSPVLQAELVPRLRQEWLQVSERQVDVGLTLGRSRELIGQLRSAVLGAPEHERFREQLVEALYRAGRSTEALAECRRTRAYLAETVGRSAGPGLYRLETAILHGAQLVPETSHGAGEEPERIRARGPAGEFYDIPADLPRFIGHDEEAAELVAQLKMVGRGPAMAVITGLPGIGKTAFAVHVAHRVRESFPGGQFVVSLGRPDGLPRWPPDMRVESPRVAGRTGALGESLSHALGMGDEGYVSAGESERRRVLLILDDVATVEQIAPLLPRLPGVAAIITSRVNLPTIAVKHGAQVYRLGILREDESRDLLVSILGANRVDTEELAVSELARLCSHLPLALRIAGARLALRPHQRIPQYVESLRADPITKLRFSDSPGASVAKRFEEFIHHLAPHLVDAFLTVATCGVAEVTTQDCELLLKLPHHDTMEVLERLVDANLLDEHDPGKYHIHTILRSFAHVAAPRAYAAG